MKSFFQTLFARWQSLSRTQKIILGCIVALALFFGISKSNQADMGVTELVKRTSLARTVLASGTVISKTDLALSFQTTQIVQSITVSVGDTVKKGQILATLSNASEQAAVKSARGGLLAAQARYKKILEGASSEDVALAEVALKNAQNDKGPQTAKQKLYSTGLVAKPFDSLSAPNAPIVSGTYTGEKGQYTITFDVNEPRGKIARFSGIESGDIFVSSTVPQSLGTKGLYIMFPATFSAVNSMQWTISIPNTESIEYPAVAAAYQQALDSYTASVNTAQAQLAVKRASARQVDIDAATADIVTAQAAVDAAVAVLEKTIIRSPADGTVTKVAINIGDTVKANDTAIVVQDIQQLYIEANVNESNIANIVSGQPVQVTYDAFGAGTMYQATVSSVDLSPTVVDGIVNYKIKAVITDSTNIKPGMTANLSIQTAYIPDALVIPERVIAQKDGVKTVQVFVGGDRSDKTISRTITTGLRGDGSMVEVTSGLVEGEKVKFIQK